jgi:secreted trypsin-like serine protease
MKKPSPFLFFVAVLLSFSIARAQDFDVRVIFGTPVSADSAVSKAMVLVMANGATCSGVAISQRHVLTAAHCVPRNPPVSKILIYAGTRKLLQPKVLNYKVHPRYKIENKYHRADLAVLKLVSPMTSAVVPVPILGSELASGAKLIMAGYGYSDPEKTKIRTLLQAEYVFGRRADLMSIFSDGSRLLRTRGPNVLCNGDSGGATFRSSSSGLRVVGIHSMADCVGLGYDIYTLDQAGWIRAMVAI